MWSISFLFLCVLSFLKLQNISASGSQSYNYRALNKMSEQSAPFKRNVDVETERNAKTIEEIPAEPAIMTSDTHCDESGFGSLLLRRLVVAVPIFVAASINSRKSSEDQEEAVVPIPPSRVKAPVEKSKPKPKPAAPEKAPVEKSKLKQKAAVPVKAPVEVEKPKPKLKRVKKERIISKTFVDKPFLGLAVVGTVFECVMSFLLLEIMNIVTEGMEHHHGRPHHLQPAFCLNLAGWAILVFGLSEMLSNIPAYLISKGKIVMPRRVMVEFYNSLKKPAWSLKFGVQRALEHLVKVSQILSLFMVWNRVRRDYEHAVVETFIWSRAVDHLWRKAFYRQKLPGFSLIVACFATAFGFWTAYEIWYLEHPLALALYVPAVLLFLYKLAWSKSVWSLNGRETFVPMKTVQKVQYYWEDVLEEE